MIQVARTKENRVRERWSGKAIIPLRRAFSLFLVAFAVLCFTSKASARPQEPSALPESRNNAPAAQTQAPPSTNSLNIPRDGNNTAQISGTVIDVTGAPVEGAQVSLLDRSGAPVLQVLTDEVGRFSFSVSAPGSFRLKVAAEGFETLTIAGELHAGENYNVPPLTLKVATEVTEVHVAPTQAQIAEDQIKQQEKQRVFGVVPNFYVTYLGDDTAPLTPKQKFELAWRTTIDPVTFIITGAVAGVQQASNFNSGYGQGAQGYGKRFGASYADLVAGTFIGGAILPSLLKQDPRYFYKGTGTFRSRALYAIANSVICKGDNKRWQVNYSNILGSLAAGGISNLYYPAQNRNGVGLTFENALIGIGATAAANLLQEFVVRKITPNLPSTAAGKTQSPVSKVLTVIEREGF